MIVIPAIDLLSGQCVRLHKGEYESAKAYDHDPPARARTFAKHATRLHVVDLAGAKSGPPVESQAIKAICDAFGPNVEAGGGVRSREAFEAYLALGARWVVLGTAAAENVALVRELAAAYPGRVIIAVDADNGIVKTAGWTRASNITAVELARSLADVPLGGVLYTDVARDGTQVGPNIEMTLAVQAVTPAEVIASGGVGTLAHIAALRDAKIGAVVVGRAIYEGAFTLEDAQKTAQGDL
jgi:phosphoribosylformimino-5-aminoimidazole carboxamide ribotide isomerase